MKRSSERSEARSKTHRPDNVYGGYTVCEGDTVLSVSEVDAFRLQFVDARRPAKLTCDPPISAKDFCLESIVKTLLYEEPLQVERKVDFGFGLGKTREHLKLRDIVSKLLRGDDSYYLTTQYEENDEGGPDAFLPEDKSAVSENHTRQLENESLSDVDAVDEDSDDDEIEGDENDPNLAPGFPAGSLAQASACADLSSDDDSIDLSDLHDDFEAESGSEIETEDIDLRVRSLFQPPLTGLVQNRSFPITPAPFANLITQQINLWMGASAQLSGKPDLLNPSTKSLGRYLPQGNSSGLHHDHADNLYVLTQGRKRFTLYLPRDAAKLYTVGNISKVFGNGLIDYHVDKNARFWRPMRDDGAIVAEWARWALENEITCEYTPKQLTAMIDDEPTYSGASDSSLDPPSFSRVPPILAHLDEITNTAEREALERFADCEFPGFRQLQKLEVWLQPGEMLYVPTGWFHEVTSFASDDGPAHIALNWWFMPPSREIKSPYVDDYWADDYETTELAISMARDTAS